MFYTFVKELGENHGGFFYTEKLSILSININGYLLLNPATYFGILLAFIIFREVRMIRKMIFFYI